LWIFFCFFFVGPSNQFLRDWSMEFPVNAESANSGLYRR
jgi:hypothetical protein